MVKTNIEEGRNKPIFLPFTPNVPAAGLGDFAGGLEIFKKLLKTIPGDTGSAWVPVLQLIRVYETNHTGYLTNNTSLQTVPKKEDLLEYLHFLGIDSPVQKHIILKFKAGSYNPNLHFIK